MKSLSMGKKKKLYKSIRLAAEEFNISYMTLYMRMRMGKTVKQAMTQPVRAYNRKEHV